jgi:hypothetical protein
MEIRPVRQDEAAALRELRLRALGDAPHAYFASLESEERLPLSYWEEWATQGPGKVTECPVWRAWWAAESEQARATGSSAALRVSPET